MNLFCGILTNLSFRDLCHLWCRPLQVTNLVGKENPPSATLIGNIRRCYIANLLLIFTLRYNESMMGRWEKSWKYCSTAHAFWRTTFILGYIWIYLDKLGYTLIYLDILRYTWTYLDILGYMYLYIHLGLLGNHSGKKKRLETSSQLKWLVVVINQF